MNAYPMQRAVASTATRGLLRATIERVSQLALEPHAPAGSVLVFGTEGYEPAALLRESTRYLDGWTVVGGVADEREHAVDWFFLEVLNAALARHGAQVETPLGSSEATSTVPRPAAVGNSLLRALAAVGGPVCLVIENIDAADRRSAEAIRFALRHNGRQPLLLLMSSEVLINPGEKVLGGLSQTRPEHDVVVRLPPLSASDIQEIAFEQIGRPLAGRVARRFAADTAGNPALVAGMFEAYRADLLNVPQPAAIDLEPGRPVPLLPRQQHALDSAPLGARTASEVVAVLREPTAIATVNRVAAWLGITETFGAFDLEGAERLGLVRVVDGADVPTIAPPSRVAADSIAAGITIERRRQIHSAAADVLTGVAVLRHRIGAMDPEDVTLVPDLVQGARNRVAVGDTDRAMSLALAAVSLAAPGAEYEKSLLFAGVLAVRLHEHQRLFQLRGDIASLPASVLRDAILADLEVLTGNREGGLERGRSVIDSPDESPTTRALRAHVATMIPLYDAINEQHELVRPHAAAARRIVAQAPVRASEVDPDLRWLVRPLEYELWLSAWELAAAARLREAERVADRMARIDQLLRGTPDSPAAVDAMVYQARTFVYAGRITDAANRLHRAIRVAPGFPDSWLRHMALTMHAHVLFLTGDWEESVATSEAALDSAFDDPYRATLPTALAASGLVFAARGEQDRVARIERMLAMLPPAGGGAIPYLPDLPDIMRAELAAALGDPLAQLRATETARTAARRGSVWSWLPLHVDALAELGRVAEAVSITNDALAGKTPWNRSPHAVSRLRARLAVATGELALAVQLYSGIVQSQTAAAQPFTLARDRVHYAKALHSSGDTLGARRQLELAAATFRNLEAATHLSRVIERLEQLEDTRATTPPQPAPPRPNALAQLSLREQEVAVAVASGLTNREVAERLYVSVTTVNFHVRNILAKLSLSSRRELRSVLHDGDARPLDGRPSAPRNQGGDEGPVRS